MRSEVPLGDVLLLLAFIYLCWYLWDYLTRKDDDEPPDAFGF